MLHGCPYGIHPEKLLVPGVPAFQEHGELLVVAKMSATDSGDIQANFRDIPISKYISEMCWAYF